MEKVDLKHKELVQKIEKGLDLTFKKLVKSKRQTGGSFVFSKNGVIKKIKAEDMED
ncbi:hypothetical protein [Mucilaginibacter sp.]|uniref:hypothetical protein n=1 Tax=Mucilaginibacter sp. TaxID=1882438 RepID=UPI003B003B14